MAQITLQCYALGTPSSFTVEISSTANVGQLRIQINQHLRLTSSEVYLSLWKVSLPDQPRLLTEGSELLANAATDESLMSVASRELGVVFDEEYWADPSKRHEKVHVLVRLPNTADLTLSQSNSDSSMKSDSGALKQKTVEDVKLQMAEIYEKYKEHIKHFVSGGALPDQLLFENLGNVVDANKTSQVYTKGATVIVYNSSGSGKTRLILDGLCHNWGLYFTSATADGIGSKDLTRLFDQFTSFGGTKETATHNNHISDKLLAILLCSRLFVLNSFLSQMLIPDSQAQRTNWTLLQTCPPVIEENDVFSELSQMLADNFLRRLDLVKELTQLLFTEIEGRTNVSPRSEKRNLFVVLDEAQVAVTLLKDIFCASDLVTPRPFLHAFFRYFQQRGDFSGIILSGTMFSLLELIKSTNSQISKHLNASTARQNFFSDLGNFDPEAVTCYVTRVSGSIIPQLGVSVLKRISHWLHGRYRFVATYVGMLKLSPESPNRVLSAYITHVTGFSPTDALDEEQCEPEILPAAQNFLREVAGFLSERIPETLKIDLQDVWTRQVLVGESTSLTPVSHDLIETGIGFLDPSSTLSSPPVVLREPLVLVYLGARFGGEHVKNYMEHQMQQHADRSHLGLLFERTCMVMFMQLFSQQGGYMLGNLAKLPMGFAQRKVQLVALRESTNGEVRRVPVSPRSGCSAQWALKAPTADVTLGWLEKPSGMPFLLPDKDMGPDLMFFCEDVEDGALLLISTQFKISAGVKPSQAFNSLIPSRAWTNKAGNQFGANKYPELRESYIKALNNHIQVSNTSTPSRSLRRTGSRLKHEANGSLNLICLFVTPHRQAEEEMTQDHTICGIVKNEVLDDYFGPWIHTLRG